MDTLYKFAAGSDSDPAGAFSAERDGIGSDSDLAGAFSAEHDGIGSDSDPAVPLVPSATV